MSLYHNVKRSEAYYGLSCYARAALFELLDRYNGINNGMIGLGVRELSQALNCAQGTACKALRELDDSKLAHPVTGGVWRGKKATEWRLTFHRCDKTGELPNLNWKPCSEFTRESTKVHQGKHKASLSSSGEAHKRKNPINVISLSSRGDAHIDIYQGGMVSDKGTGCQPDAEVTPPLDPSLENPKPINKGSKNFGPSNFDADSRLASLSKWGRAAMKPWTKPTILSDEVRDFTEFSLEQRGVA